MRKENWERITEFAVEALHREKFINESERNFRLGEIKFADDPERCKGHDLENVFAYLLQQWFAQEGAVVKLASLADDAKHTDIIIHFPRENVSLAIDLTQNDSWLELTKKLWGTLKTGGKRELLVVPAEMGEKKEAIPLVLGVDHQTAGETARKFYQLYHQQKTPDFFNNSDSQAIFLTVLEEIGGQISDLLKYSSSSTRENLQKAQGFFKDLFKKEQLKVDNNPDVEFKRQGLKTSEIIRALENPELIVSQGY